MEAGIQAVALCATATFGFKLNAGNNNRNIQVAEPFLPDKYHAIS